MSAELDSLAGALAADGFAFRRRTELVNAIERARATKTTNR